MKISSTFPFNLVRSLCLHTLRPRAQFGFPKRTYLFTLLLAVAFVSQGQRDKTFKPKYFKVAFSNSHAAKPFGSFTSLFYRDFHPGAEIGYESILKNNARRVWFYELRMGYMFHQWVQHNIAIYGNVGYRHELIPSWYGELKLGGGYQHSISDSKVYKVTESDGVKEKKNIGRSQAIANFTVAISKKLSRASETYLFLEYRQQIQTPFIREYVPVLPYNSMLLGVKFPLNSSTLKVKK